MTEPGLDFSTVIASAVHDMKNSLALLKQAMAGLCERLPLEEANSRERGIMEYEAARLSGMMMQMLGLYKLGQETLPLKPGFLEVEDFLFEQLARHDEIFLSRQIHGRCEVEPGLTGFFDHDLVGTVIANVISNSIRYARESVLLRAWQEADFLVLAVADDGQGYPKAMLEDQSNYVRGISQATGSTGLGLYFSARIAELHERAGVHGYILLSNDSPLGGGEFRLYLP